MSISESSDSGMLGGALYMIIKSALLALPLNTEKRDKKIIDAVQKYGYTQ
jgi:hypothetical protein